MMMMMMHERVGWAKNLKMRVVNVVMTNFTKHFLLCALPILITLSPKNEANE